MEDIYHFIAEDNITAAQNVVNGIYKSVQMLHRFLKLGYKFRNEIDGEIRILLYDHYRIAYLMKHENIIDILGIFHGALDLDRYLI